MTSNEERLHDALYGAAREIGDAATPTDLLRNGIRKVRIIPRDKMAAFIERAVQKVLEERRANDGEVSLLVGDVQTGLLGLLRGARDVEAARRDIAEQRHSLEGELAELEHDRDPQAELDRRASAASAGGPESAADRAARERDLTIDRLERRIAKLIATLEKTELALQSALKTQHLDIGIASLYRVVQGLASNDPLADQKRAMMREIFQANVDLNSAFARDQPT